MIHAGIREAENVQKKKKTFEGENDTRRRDGAWDFVKWAQHICACMRLGWSELGKNENGSRLLRQSAKDWPWLCACQWLTVSFININKISTFLLSSIWSRSSSASAKVWKLCQLNRTEHTHSCLYDFLCVLSVPTHFLVLQFNTILSRTQIDAFIFFPFCLSVCCTAPSFVCVCVCVAYTRETNTRISIQTHMDSHCSVLTVFFQPWMRILLQLTQDQNKRRGTKTRKKPNRKHRGDTTTNSHTWPSACVAVIWMALVWRQTKIYDCNFELMLRCCAIICCNFSSLFSSVLSHQLEATEAAHVVGVGTWRRHRSKTIFDSNKLEEENR